MNTDVVQLTKQLVSIPSFVSGKTDETQIGEFVMKFVSSYLPDLPVIKQPLFRGSNRFNLFIGNPQPEVVFLGHLDTVQPQVISNTINERSSKNVVFGLGSSDMKGSIASFLTALVATQDKINPNKLGLLLYCDEEYDFKGMKSYIKLASKTAPKLVISLDGNLQLSSGCRGLIEISGTVIGKSAHSSKPYLGVNAISNFIEVVKLVDQILSRKFDALLGPTTSNLAYLNGGTNQGNIIPSKAIFIYEVRPSNSQIYADFVIKKLTTISSKAGLKIQDLSVRHDLRPWPPAYKSKYFELFSSVLKKQGLNNNPSSRFYSGYIDTAMLESIYPGVPKYVFGAGGENQHSPNEFVPIKNLILAQQVYEQLIYKLAKK